jgi:hypothetical protein
VSINQRVVPAHFARFAPHEGVELGRFCLADSLAANAESYCLALSKARLSETGERYALERLAVLGAPQRQHHKSGVD